MNLQECLKRIEFLETRLRYYIKYETELKTEISLAHYNELIDSDLEEYKRFKTLIKELKNKSNNE